MKLVRHFILLTLVSSSFAAQSIGINNQSSCELVHVQAKSEPGVEHHTASGQIASHHSGVVSASFSNSDAKMADVYKVQCRKANAYLIVAGDASVWIAALDGLDAVRIKGAENISYYDDQQITNPRRYNGSMVLVNAS